MRCVAQYNINRWRRTIKKYIKRKLSISAFIWYIKTNQSKLVSSNKHALDDLTKPLLCLVHVVR